MRAVIEVGDRVRVVTTHSVLPDSKLWLVTKVTLVKAHMSEAYAHRPSHPVPTQLFIEVTHPEHAARRDRFNYIDAVTLRGVLTRVELVSRRGAMRAPEQLSLW